MTQQIAGELGSFLRTRRSLLQPDELGLSSYGRRRVPGLRREELAQLAGVSVAYLTRLEQGTSTSASDGVLDALATALELDADERAHLKLLARPPRRAKGAVVERPSAHLRGLVGGLSGTPAILLGRFQDVLCWNAEGHRLFGSHLAYDSPDHLQTRPNLVRQLFLDPHGQHLYRDRDIQANYSVSALRYAAAEFPDDGRLPPLVGELSTGSEDFAQRWARRSVRKCTGGTKHFCHPEFGDLDLRFESFEVSDQPGQRLLLLSPEPGSGAESGLALLSMAARCESARQA